MDFSKKITLFLLITTLAIAQMAVAGHPDILTDFLLPPNSPPPDGNFFTYTGFRSIVNAPPPPTFKVVKATMEQFSALKGQSVSYGVLMYPGGSVNPVHTHPRSTELLFVTQGTLEVGFLDTTNKLYTQTVEAGDLFEFPNGLVHFQYNADAKNPAFAVSAFGNANAGTVSLRTICLTLPLMTVFWLCLSKLMLPPFRSSKLA